MREKNYSTGLRGVLFEAGHYRRMGAAVWLYGWLVLRQTHQSGAVGWVLGGAPVTYREIEEETGFPSRTLEGWMRTLRREGYIQTEAVPGGMVIRITKAKKFVSGPRASAEGVRRVAGGGTRSGVGNGRQVQYNQQDAEGISSSSVGVSKPQPADIHSDFHSHRPASHEQHQNPSPSGLGTNQTDATSRAPWRPTDGRPEEQANFFKEARLRLQLLRAEREEAVQRELAVGSGPEVRRS
jgi:hypothetical protein